MEVFVENILRLLDLEREAEKAENSALIENISPKQLQKQGICLLNLRLSSRKSGMFGRILVNFAPFSSDRHLPSHSLTPGDIVALSPSHGDTKTDVVGTGVVVAARGDTLSVAFDDFSCAGIHDLNDDEKWKVVKLANEITYKRLKRALEKLRSYRQGPACHLVEVLIGAAERRPPLNVTQSLQFRNGELNVSQRDAVTFALSQPDVAVIHGPPGTGKSTTLVEIIEQAASTMKMKVLACAPSNVAVDNLVARLVAGGVVRPVRLGHPARVDANIQKYALDAMIAGSEEKQLARDVRKDLDDTMAKLRKCRSAGEKQSLRQEMKFLRKEIFQREEAATRTILKHANVVLATLTSSSDDGPIRLQDAADGFDLVVIDECSQALEASCWIALLQGKRCILAGDHQQLPPTILSKQAATEGLERTLMERVLSEHGDDVMRMLTVQYRMHEAIMRWPSEQLYHGRLEAHESVARHRLSDLPDVEDTDDTSIPLLLIDTAGCNLPELVLEDQVSKGNEGEADLVEVHVESLVGSGVKAEDIAVIAPYNLQVELIRKRLAERHRKLEIKSVDSFQGREKEAVVISLVRSNDSGDVGFLAEDRRINVAITRARRHLAVICDTSTVSKHEFLKSLVEYISNEGEVRTAHQYRQEHDIGRSTVDSSKISKTKSKAKLKSDKNDKSKPKEDTRRDWEVVKKNEPSFPALKKIVEEFVKDIATGEYQFSTALTKAERKYVHEICEELGIHHESHGEENQRYMIISKRSKSSVISKEKRRNSTDLPSSDNAEENSKTKVILKTEIKLKSSEKSTEIVREKLRIDSGNNLQQGDIPELVKINPKNVHKPENVHKPKPVKTDPKCSQCGNIMPQQNFDLHLLRCQNERRFTKTDSESKPDAVEIKPDVRLKSADSTSTRKNKNKHKLQKTCAIANVEENDFDALIAAAQKQDNVCNYVKCKEITTTIGQLCKFCRRKYCFRHYIAEVHGCGDLAKQDARATIVREGKLYPGSGAPSKKPDPTKRAHLQRKLDEQICEKQTQRRTKKKEK